MKKLILFIFTIIITLTLSAHPAPCEGTLTWDDEYVHIAYENGHIKTMNVVDYYSDDADDFFIISATDEEGSLMRIKVKELPFYFSISVEYKNNNGDNCLETRMLSK
jgi:hypothetical protein